LFVLLLSIQVLEGGPRRPFSLEMSEAKGYAKQVPEQLLIETNMATTNQEGRCKVTWKREFKLLWREAGPPNHHDDKVDSDW